MSSNMSTCQLSCTLQLVCLLTSKKHLKVRWLFANSLLMTMNGLWNMNARVCQCSVCCCHTRQAKPRQAELRQPHAQAFDIRLQTGLSPAKNPPRESVNRMHMTKFWLMVDRSIIFGPPSAQGLFPCRPNSTSIPKTATVVPVATTWPT